MHECTKKCRCKQTVVHLYLYYYASNCYILHINHTNNFNAHIMFISITTVKSKSENNYAVYIACMSETVQNIFKFTFGFVFYIFLALPPIDDNL